MVAIVVLAISCKKKHGSAPEPGSLGGSINPIGAFARVDAVDVSGKRHSSEVSSTTGQFRFGGLAAGRYRLEIPADPRYLTDVVLEVEVSAGQYTDAGLISIQPVLATTGAIVGNVLPIGFGMEVFAVDRNSGQRYVTVPLGSNGRFMLAVPNGNYRLGFTALAPVEAPPEMEVSVVGKAVDVGSVVCKTGNSGSIVGKVQPISGLASVSATDVLTGSVVHGTIDRIAGIVRFPVMIAGTYRIAMATNVPYLVPATVQVQVNERSESDMGLVSLVQDQSMTVVSYSVGRSGLTRYNVKGSFIAGSLKFSQTQVSFLNISPTRSTVEHATLTVSMEGISGPGSYTFNGTANSNITYQVLRNSGISQTLYGNWSVAAASTTGKLEVQSIDPVARRIRGTFSAMLSREGTAGMPAVQEVKNGVFYLEY